MTNDEAWNKVAYELGAERRPDHETVIAALRARLEERVGLCVLIQRVCIAPHLTLDEAWLAEAKRLGCRL